MADVSDGAIAFVYEQLAADNGLAILVNENIYEGQAGEDDPLPYVIINPQSESEDGTSIAGDLGAAHIMMLVKAVTQDSGFDSAVAIRDRIRLALHKQKGLTAGVIVRECIRVSGVRYIENDPSGVRYNHLGDIYRMTVSEL